jgi:uncharacterized membrane protein (DUF373 family)
MDESAERSRRSLPEPSVRHPHEGRSWLHLAERAYPILVRALTGIVILVLCLWMLAGAVNMLVGLGEVYARGWRGIAEHAIISSLIMLAMLEVIRTLQSYLLVGRVRVTFILDTALVVLIGELIGLWFKEYSAEKVLLGLGVIVTLVVLRIATGRFSPEPEASAQPIGP